MEASAVDWEGYFKSIRAVCPWSWAAWRKGAIDVRLWDGEIYPLGSWEARVYICVNTSPRKLKKQMDKLNYYRPEDEWLFSHPRYKGHSSPVPILIQQDHATLENIRKNHSF